MKLHPVFRIINNGIVSAITGLGVFTWFAIFDWNPIACLFFGLFGSSMMMLILKGDSK